MTTLSVHEPPDPPADRLDRAERLVLVKDGFVWGAFLVPPLYFLWRKSWAGLALYLAGTGLIAALAFLLDLASGPVTVLNVALSAILGFEAPSLERWMLERRGWQDLGTVTGDGVRDCERRFFDDWLAAQPILTTPAASAAPPGEPPARRGRILGLWQARSPETA